MSPTDDNLIIQLREIIRDFKSEIANLRREVLEKSAKRHAALSQVLAAVTSSPSISISPPKLYLDVDYHSHRLISHSTESAATLPLIIVVGEEEEEMRELGVRDLQFPTTIAETPLVISSDSPSPLINIPSYVSSVYKHFIPIKHYSTKL